MRALWRRNGKDEAGFTLIELAIALAILGILVAIAVPTYLTVRNRAYDAEAKQNLGAIRSLAWSYYLEHASWDEVDDLTPLGMDASHTTDNWEFFVDFSDDDLIRLCAKPTATAPFDNRFWSLELKPDGSAVLEGPDATTCDQ